MSDRPDAAPDPPGPAPTGRAAPSPGVSVVLPCRDAEATLPACMRSLEAQTADAVEVLAVDDGSRDGTRRLLDAWAARDRRVRVLAAGGDGLVAALRLGASAARAPLVARMDADDVAHPERLEAQRRFLEERPDLAACGTGVRYFPRDALGPGYRRYERWLNGLRSPEELQRDLFVECPVAHPTLMVRREALEAAGGYRDRGWPEDYDLLLRLHRAGLRVANVPRVLLRWRLGPARLSERSAAYSPDAFRRCKVHHLLRSGFLPDGRPLAVWGAGRVGKALARELIRRGRRPAAFVDLDPRKVGQEIHGATVVDPAGLRSRLARATRAGPADAGGGGARLYVLAAVGSPGARGEIRHALTAMGLDELRDFRALA